jgi:hypothetical protein
MQAYPVRLYFTKRHTAGTLRGLYTLHSLGFCAVEDAVRWLANVTRNARVLGYEIADKSFQGYARGVPVQ